MIELVLIKYLLNRTLYNKYHRYVKITNKELERIYHCIKPLLEEGDKDEYTPVDLELKFFSAYPFMKDGEKEQYKALFERLNGVEADVKRVEELLKKQREAVLARQLGELSLEVSEGKGDFKTILDHLSKIELDSPIKEEIQFVTDDLEELYNKQVAASGLRWRLNSLNRSLGSLRRGDFGFLFARPETGKTTFLASEVSYMAHQATTPVLWFNNEEQGEKVMLRCYQAALGYTQEQLYADLQGNKKKFQTYTKGNFKMIDAASIHRSEIERICEVVKPSLIVFDQIDKLAGFEGAREDLMLGSIYIWAREMAKKYCPIIGVTQADGTGEGVKRLTMKHVANAKTAKQAEADWILGIGKSDDEGLAYVRHLNVSKNKLQGDKDSIPSMRHGYMDIIIEPELSRYKDFD